MPHPAPPGKRGGDVRNERVTTVRVDPIVLEVVEGTLTSVEAAVERTSRSPMIREARDFRARPFFDRGPGYRLLSGRDHAKVDVT